MKSEELISKFSEFDLANFSIFRPTNFVFLCGGKRDENDHLTSIRSFFLKELNDGPELLNASVLLAEDVNVFYPDSKFDNLIEFEKIVASASISTTIFLESPGSIAELGAFSEIPELEKRLLIFVDAKFHDGEPSFISDGPLRAIRNNSEDFVQTIDVLDEHFELVERKLKQHSTIFFDKINAHIKAAKNSSKFNPKSHVHLIVLALFVCETMGASTSREIAVAFERMGQQVEESQLRRLLYVAKSIEWVSVHRRGSSRYYFNATSAKLAETSQRKNFDLIRYKSDFIDFWEKNDRQRFLLIQELRGG